MAPFPWDKLAIIAALILVNGVFSLSEMAIVSARPAQLRVLAERGSKGAKTALALAADPGKFLSTVQIGITLVGIIAGAYSGAALGGPLGDRFAALGVPVQYAEEAGFAAVIALTTYFSLVVGELVPKQAGLRIAVPVALAMSRPMALIAKIAAPFVWVLDTSSATILRLIGVRHRGEHGLTAEELQMVFADATRSGAIEEDERAIMAGIMKLANRPVRELMTPRTELHWIDKDAGVDEIRAEIAASPHSLMPVADGSPDKILGIAKVRDLLAAMLAGDTVDLAVLAIKPEVIPDQLDSMDALRILQQSGVGMAMVHDEYGHLEGVVTPADLLMALVGTFVSHQDEGDSPQLVERVDGSLLVAGSLPADQLAERLGIELPEDREFATAAGYALSVLKRLPQEGEYFDAQGWRFEVVDMDGLRIDKLLVSELTNHDSANEI
ncbi:MAG: hemolysin family protein [Candidatus Andeanibacterium colombiense]|uniref:Hemolysin family protein n=1 Tax=Candidatus Andeanibacterium colombiense TaxID=3121345 RepID=A0AAJ6BNF1_9SPHN|nr:MAG: hemolysin family protein [Sphingomonadaceae bacterium]